MLLLHPLPFMIWTCATSRVRGTNLGFTELQTGVAKNFYSLAFYFFLGLGLCDIPDAGLGVILLDSRGNHPPLVA